MSLKETLETAPHVLLRQVWLEAAGILVILLVGIAMELLQEGQGFLRLTIFCVIGLGIHLSYSIRYILKRQYSVIEGEIAEIKSQKLHRKWVEIKIQAEKYEQKKLLIPVEYRVTEGKNYRFYIRKGTLLAAEEM